MSWNYLYLLADCLVRRKMATNLLVVDCIYGILARRIDVFVYSTNIKIKNKGDGYGSRNKLSADVPRHH